MDDRIAGSSAQAEYERRAARHAAEVRRRRPRILAFGAVVAIAGLVVPAVNPLWGAVVLLFDLAFVMSALLTIPTSITAWRIGAEGGVRPGRLLEPPAAEGFRILHDRRIPASPANIGHTVFGPPGIFVVETKSYAGSLRIQGDEVFVAGRRKTRMVDEAKREASAIQAALAGEIATRGWTVTPVPGVGSAAAAGASARCRPPRGDALAPELGQSGPVGARETVHSPRPQVAA